MSSGVAGGKITVSWFTGFVGKANPNIPSEKKEGANGAGEAKCTLLRIMKRKAHRGPKNKDNTMESNDRGAGTRVRPFKTKKF